MLLRSISHQDRQKLLNTVTKTILHEQKLGLIHPKTTKQNHSEKELLSLTQTKGCPRLIEYGFH